MELALSKPVSRLAAIGLLLLTLALFHALILRPFARSWHDAVAGIEDARVLAAGYARTAAARPQYEEQVAELRSERPDLEWFLIGETDALAAAALQDRIGSLALSAGAELRSIQTAPTVDEDGMPRIDVTVELVAKTASLLRFAHAIETGIPYLFITLAEAIADPGQGDIEDPGLIVRLEISGYREPAQP